MRAAKWKHIDHVCVLLASHRGGAFRENDRSPWTPWQMFSGVEDGPPMRRRVDAKRWVERELAKVTS